MISIFDEFKKTDLIFDKTTQTLSALPFNFDDCRIKVNNTVTQSVLNDIIKKLHYNTLFSYRCCCVADFNMFDSLLYTISGKANNEFDIISNDRVATNKNNDMFTGSTACAVCLDITNSLQNYIIVGRGDNIAIFKSTQSSFTFILSTSKISSSFGEIEFKNITSIKNFFDNDLYIVDSVYNNVYLFDSSSLTEEENIYNGEIVIRNIIGGVGEVYDKSKFGSIDDICINRDIVVIQDSKNKCFKVYDRQLNWKNTSVFSRMFDSVQKFTTTILDDNNYMYCGKDTDIYKFFIQNNVISLVGVFSIATYCEPGETIKEFTNCFNNRDVFYALTTNSIKKVWFSDLEYVIGSFGDRMGLDMKWMGVTTYADGRDLLYFYSLSGEKEFSSINLDTVFIDTILDNTEFEIYSQDDLLFNKDEYMQSWGLVKSFKKIYLNNLILLQHIKYKFLQSNVNGKIIVDKYYNKGFLSFVDNFKFNEDLLIGVNEIFQSDIFNRCIITIIDVQRLLLLYIINNDTDIRYLSPDPYRNSVSIKNYVYYVDGSISLTPNPCKLEIFAEFKPIGGISLGFGGAPYTGIDGISINNGILI